MPSWSDKCEGAPIPTHVPSASELADVLERALATARAHDSGWMNQEERRALMRARVAITLTLEHHTGSQEPGSTQAIYEANRHHADRVRRGEIG